jgi:peptidoglycan/LPS O-acetylase OafA/YrhL
MRSIAQYLARPFTDPNRKRSSHGDSLFALDGVRGLAVLIVIASHSDAFGLSGQGSVGVLLFFTLSGFVLSLPFYDAPKRILDPAEAARFFINRVLRIVPIFVVAVLVIRLQRGETWEWAFANLAFKSGWLHLWSVAEEARFYALFPLVIAALSLLKTKIARSVLLGVMIFIAWKFQYFHMIDMLSGGAVVQFYFWFFLAGILSAILYGSLQQYASVGFVRATLGSAPLLMAPLLFATPDSAFNTIWRPLFPSIPAGFSLNGWHQPEMWCVVFIVCLVGVTVVQRSIASRLMQSRVMRHLGLLSYSMYLFHIPILIQLQSFELQNETLFAATFFFTYIIAIVSYLAVEKPFLMLKPTTFTWRRSAVAQVP